MVKVSFLLCVTSYARAHALPGKSDHEYTGNANQTPCCLLSGSNRMCSILMFGSDVFSRPITVIAHSTLHVSSHTSHYAARHGADETAVILASIQVHAAAGLFNWCMMLTRVWCQGRIAVINRKRPRLKAVAKVRTNFKSAAVACFHDITGCVIAGHRHGAQKVRDGGHRGQPCKRR